MQCLIKQISLSIINNHLSLMSLLQVSICTKFIIREIYTKACTSVQQILSQIRMCRMKIQHCQLELPKVFTNIQQIFFLQFQTIFYFISSIADKRLCQSLSFFFKGNIYICCLVFMHGGWLSTVKLNSYYISNLFIHCNEGVCDHENMLCNSKYYTCQHSIIHSRIKTSHDIC